MRTTTYPPAARDSLVELLHGQPVADPYRWLEDAEDAETVRWSAAQEDLWRATPLPARERLLRRALDLADAGTVTAPVRRDGRSFVLRRLPGQMHPVLYADERVVLDPGALDPSGTTVLDAWDPSPDGGRVTVQLSRGGTEQGTLYVLDVETGDVLGAPIPGCRYSPVAWLSREAFYYVLDGRLRLRRVTGEDVEVCGAPPGRIGLGISADGRWLTVATGTGLGLADLREGEHTAPPLRAVHEAVSAAVGIDGRLYLAVPTPEGMSLEVASPLDPARRKVLLPADPDALLADFTVLPDVLLVVRLRDGVSELTVHRRDSGEALHPVTLPGSGTLGRLSSDGHSAWFTYTDPVTPPQVWQYAENSLTLFEAAPGRIAVPAVETHTLTATSADGTPVRITLLTPPGDGPRPTILHGYGGFGLPLTPVFAADALTWIASGGALAIAHLRGGPGTREQATRARKQNVFDDFLAAAELLVSTGRTSPERLAVWGESNGGLLAGAAITQRPDLFAAAVCAAPLLDMVRYERTGLGPAWTAEYGTASDPGDLASLLAYSPYHHVRPGTRYPATLFATYDGDTRVDPLHARKMCAALQWATGASAPIVLRHEPEVGHAGRSHDRAAGLVADLLAFLAAHTGLEC
ncbi:prolyl oligopeptidase family serine peptidase [Actinocorallia longicatena]|uniref:prolyl oligopeptidase n=1 Tax=Actinocorallia longicatena TaxID=111803 RepID=A0ABP6Q8U4_9ACTN